MNMSSKLRRTILCLPLFFWIGDRLHAAPLFQAGADAGAQQITLATRALERCAEVELVVGQQNYRIACDRIVASPGVRLWEGHVSASAGRKLSFQIRPEGTTGLLDLPGRPLRLGLVDGVQWLLDTPAEQLQAELADIPPPLFVLRETAASQAKAEPRDRGADPSRDAQTKHGEAAPAGVGYAVSLNLADLASVQPGGQVDLALPGLQQNITYEKTVVSPTGSSTWIGHLTQYGRDYPVVLTYGVDGSTSGSIQGPSGEWLVTGKPGATWLVDTLASGLQHNPNAKDDDAVPPEAAGHAEAITAGATARNDAGTATTPGAGPQDNATVVDVLVLYTPGLVARYGGEAGAANRIDHFISLANQAYANGGIGITLRRVGLQRVELADNTGNSTTLGLLRSGGGVFASIPALRNAIGADGVLLVRPFDMAGQGGNCGVGYIGGYGGTDLSGYADYAYAVVSEGSDTKGQPYYCTDTTFAHELGHNMGLMHDRATVTRQGGGSGALPYAYGYGRSGVFGTVMSYLHPVVVRFSNPLDPSCGNGPCGIPSTDALNSADNARALGITRAPFSAFRATTAANRVSIAGVITIDGKVAPNVKLLADGAQCALSSSTGAYACYFAAGWSGTLTASAADVSFTPPSEAYTDLQVSTSRNFSGLGSTLAISGTATVDGKPAGGVTVFAGATSCASTTTTGSFTCRVARNWSGTISGSSASATFKPVSLEAVNSAQSIVLVGTSKTVPVTISGVVRVNGLAAAGASISATGATCSASNASGAYLCTLMSRTSGTLRASYPGTTFTPATRSFSNILAPMTHDFNGTRPRIAITGVVTVKGKPRAGAAVNAAGTLCGVSNAAGEFGCTRPKTWSGRIDAPSLSRTAFRYIPELNLPTRVNLAIP